MSRSIKRNLQYNPSNDTRSFVEDREQYYRSERRRSKMKREKEKRESKPKGQWYD